MSHLDEMQLMHCREILDVDECAYWIERAEDEGLDTAPVYTPEGERIATHLRHCMEVTLFDEGAADALYVRFHECYPNHPLLQQTSGLHERLRVCRYDEGHLFVPHTDAPIDANDGKSTSRWTLVLYLNDDFEGGQTTFPDPWSETFVVEPICGDAIIFDHDVLHAGAEVFAGSKYILRGDFLAR